MPSHGLPARPDVVLCPVVREIVDTDGRETSSNAGVVGSGTVVSLREHGNVVGIRGNDAGVAVGDGSGRGGTRGVGRRRWGGGIGVGVELEGGRRPRGEGVPASTRTRNLDRRRRGWPGKNVRHRRTSD